MFPEIPEAFHNTLEISNKVNLKLQFGKLSSPEFEVPEGYNADSYLEKLIWKGSKENIQNFLRKSRKG
ncbi:hypothetical protein MAL07_19760 (plasmid) [Leptospira noguchii]|nr:hypothetical protein MAL07_19760 [Leptospira noguchii]